MESYAKSKIASICLAILLTIVLYLTFLDNRFRKKKETFVCFVDARKAFDRVDRDLLWFQLIYMGISSTLWNALRYLYKGVKACVRINDKLPFIPPPPPPTSKMEWRLHAFVLLLPGSGLCVLVHKFSSIVSVCTVWLHYEKSFTILRWKVRSDYMSEERTIEVNDIYYAWACACGCLQSLGHTRTHI